MRQNVEKSYRQGIEVSGRYSWTKNLSFFVNAAISENKIVNFTEFLDEYDENWEVKGQKEIFYAKTDIAFSPNLLAGAGFDYSPFRDFGIALTSRYVGKQFLDNTASEKRKTDAFFVADLRLNYALNFRNFARTSITLLVNNLTNEMYAPNGYTYGWYQGGERTSVNYFYPQAGRNFLLGVQLIF